MTDRPADPVRRTALPMVARRLTVLRVEDLSPALRRVVLGGPDLAGFRCDGPTDHAKVYVPLDPAAEPAQPVQVDGTWTLPAGAEPTVCREYTVRTWDPASGELALDMAVHAHGPAGRWAAAAAPGRTLVVLGPKTTKVPPTDLGTYVLAVDETGLPGAANWLEQLPGDARVVVLAEVDGADHEVPLPAHPGADVRWLHRDGAAAGTTTLLADAVAHALPADGPRPGWVWAAAEASAVRGVRRHVTGALGMTKGTFQATGYWRVGVAGFDHKSPEATA